MRSTFLYPALVAALVIGMGTTRSFALDATLDVYYSSYAEEVPGNDDFVDEYSDPVFVSIGLRRWDTLQLWEPLFTVELGGGPAKYAGSGELDGYYYYKFRSEGYVAYRFNKDFSPFIGLGYRWLYDDSGGKTTSTGFSSYDRQSQYFYLPVGGLYQFTDAFRIKPSSTGCCTEDRIHTCRTSRASPM